MKRFAVLGSGIAYTKSPLIHSQIYKTLGIDASYSVEDIPPGALADNIQRLLTTYDGFNVTQPFKKEILQYVSSTYAAVNTVLPATRQGYNTDGDGFMTDLLGFTGDVCGFDTLVLGAGGAAEIVVEVLVKAGANVMIYNRTRASAEQLAARTGGSVELTTPPRLIVNCTSVGWDRQSNPLPTSVDVSRLEYAYDLIYPPFITPFLAYARLIGAKTRNGWGMLVHQAIKADEIFLGKQLEYEMLCSAVMKEITV